MIERDCIAASVRGRHVLRSFMVVCAIVFSLADISASARGTAERIVRGIIYLKGANAPINGFNITQTKDAVKYFDETGNEFTLPHVLVESVVNSDADKSATSDKPELVLHTVRYDSSLSFVSSGDELAIDPHSGAVEIWDIKTRLLKSFLRPTGLTCNDNRAILAVNPDGRTYAAFCEYSYLVFLYDVKNGKILRAIKLPRISESFNSYPMSLIAEQYDYFNMKKYKYYRGGARRLKYTTDGKRFAVQTDNRVFIFNSLDQTTIGSVPNEWDVSYEFNADGTLLYFGGYKGAWDGKAGEYKVHNVRLLTRDIDAGRLVSVKDFATKHKEESYYGYYTAAVSPNGLYFKDDYYANAAPKRWLDAAADIYSKYCVSNNGIISEINYIEKECESLREFKYNESHYYGFTQITAIRDAQDGRELFTATRSEFIAYDISGGKALFNSYNDRSETLAVDISSGNTLFSAIDNTSSGVFDPIGNRVALFNYRGVTVSPILSSDNEFYEKAECDPRTIAISAAGDKMAATCENGTVGVWDVQSRKLERVLRGHKGIVPALLFTPDGNRIVSGGYDSKIIVWDLNLDKKTTLKGTNYSVSALAITKDGKTLFSTSHNGQIYKWDMKSGKGRVIKNANYYIFKMSISPDGSLVAVSGYNKPGQCMLFESTSGEEKKLFDAAKEQITAIEFSPDGKTIAAGDMFGKVIIWSLDGGIAKELYGNKSEISSILFSTDGSYLSSHSSDGDIRIWDIGTAVQKYYRNIGRYFLPSGLSQGYSILFVDDGHSIAYRSSERDIRLWKYLEEGGETVEIGNRPTGPGRVSFSANGNYLTTSTRARWNLDSTINGDVYKSVSRMNGTVSMGNEVNYSAYSSDGAIILYDLDERRYIDVLNDGSHYDIRKILFSVSNRLLATAGFDGDYKQLNINIWNVDYSKQHMKNSSLKNRFKIISIADGWWGFQDIEFSPDETRIACLYLTNTGQRRQVLTIWNLGERDPDSSKLNIYQDGNSYIRTFSFSGSGVYAAVVHEDKVDIWDLVQGKLYKSFKVKSISSAAFSNDDKRLYLGGLDGRMRSVDIMTEKVDEFDRHGGAITSISVRQYGNILATASDDDTIKLYNTDTMELLITLVSFAGGSWFAVDPMGRFDCSNCSGNSQNSGKRYLRWIYKNRVVTAEQLYDQLWHPGLLRVAVSTGKLAPVSDVAGLFGDIAPQVDVVFPGGSVKYPISTKGETANIIIEATDMGGGIEEPRLEMEGRPYGSVSADVTSVDAPKGTKQFKFNVPLLPGLNRITAVASSRSGMDSDRLAETVINCTSEKVKSPELYVLTVGIDKYKDASLTLKYAVSDADALDMVFEKDKNKLYKEIHHYKLRNEEATLPMIKGKLEEIRKKARITDVIIIFLAGHGKSVGDKWFFLPYENMGLSPQKLKNNALSSDDLREAISPANNQARKILLVLDACQSGEMVLAMERATGALDNEKLFTELARGTGTFIYAASTDAQFASENFNGHGVFTYAAIEGLQGAADLNRNGSIEAGELQSYLGEKVPEYSQKIGGRQEPRNYSGNFTGAGPAIHVYR